MARSYKRDKNGRFASTGSSGGGSGKELRKTVQAKRSIGANKTSRYNATPFAVGNKGGPIKKNPSKTYKAETPGLGGNAVNKTKQRRANSYSSLNANGKKAVRVGNTTRSRRDNANVVESSRQAVQSGRSRYSSRTAGKSERQIVQSKVAASKPKIATHSLKGGTASARRFNNASAAAVNKNLVATTRNPKLGRSLRADNQLLMQRKAARIAKQAKKK